MANILYEWVVIRGDTEYYLTENQYKYFIDHQDERLVAFDGFAINPAFVSDCYRRPAQRLKEKYPCGKCYTTGFIHSEPCKDCEGTGVLLPK